MKKFKLLYLLPIAGMIFSGCDLFKKEEPEQQETPKDFVGLSFEDKTVVYNGADQKIEVAGLPEGASVSYGTNGNTFKNVGVYEVTATVSGAGYNNKSLTATLTITKADFENLAMLPKEFVYDGQPHTIALTGTLPEGENAVFTYKDGFASGTEPGVYEIKASVTAPNYNTLDLSAYMTISNGPAVSARMIEDFEGYTPGDAGTLKEGYAFDYYPSNGWADVPASAGKIEPNSDSLLGNGSKFLDMTASHSAAAFRFYPKATKFAKDYKKYTGFAFDSCLVDVDPDGMTSLQFQVYYKDIPLPAQYAAMKDAWATYTLEQSMSRNWIHWEVPFDDSSVSIMNGDVQLSQVAQLGFTMADLSLYIDKIAIVVKPNYMGGSKCHALIDNIQLLAGEVTKSSTQSILPGRYSQEVEIESVKHIASLELDPNFTAGEYLLDGVSVSALTVEKEGNSYKFSAGENLIVAADIVNGGLRVTSVTGTYAANFAYLDGLWYPRVANVNYDLQDKASATESSALGDANWLQEKYDGGWKSAGNQMYVKKNGDAVWTCLGTGWKMDYRYTYIIPATKTGLANNFSLDVGNDRDANAKEIKIKVKLIRADGTETFVVGTDSVYVSVPAGTTKFNTVLAHNNDFEEAEVRAIQIIVKSTDGSAGGFLYIDNMQLDYRVIPQKTIADGSYCLWNGSSDAYTMELGDSLTSAVVKKIGGDPMNFTASVDGRDVTIAKDEEIVIKGRITKSNTIKVISVTGTDETSVKALKGSFCGKRINRFASVNLDFEGTTTGTDFNDAHWSSTKYTGGAWVAVTPITNVMKCRAKGSKVVNMRADDIPRNYIYTPDFPIGPVNHVEIDLGNYWNDSFGAVQYKVSLLDATGNVVKRLAGTDSDFAVMEKDVDATALTHFSFDIALTFAYKIQITVKCPAATGGNNTWFYMDNIIANVQ